MSIATNTIGVWDSRSQVQVLPASSQRIVTSPKVEETEAYVSSLKAKVIHYLKNYYRGNDDSLKVELPSINSGGRGGSIFSATKIWGKIYLAIERKNDRSADTASIRWICIKAENFQNLLESSLRAMLTEDVPLLKRRAHLRTDFWNHVKGGENN